jgi:hypothetical protein
MEEAESQGHHDCLGRHRLHIVSLPIDDDIQTRRCFSVVNFSQVVSIHFSANERYVSSCSFEAAIGIVLKNYILYIIDYAPRDVLYMYRYKGNGLYILT